MKILVVSDSHGNYYSLNDLYLNNSDVDYFFHLGDSELPEYLLNNFACVKGNCDFASLPKFKDLEIEGLKIHLEHGDNFKFQCDPQKYVTSLNVDIFLFGHTHKKLATKFGNTFVFNPGSLTRPRDGSKGSYLILDVSNGQLVSYKFYEVNR